MRSIPIAIVLAFLLAGSATSQEAPTVDDLIAPVRDRIEHPDEPFQVVVAIRLKDGTSDAFETAFASRMSATRSEPGNLFFLLGQDLEDPHRYLLHEGWQNLSAYRSHMGSTHMSSFWPIYFPMVAEVPTIDVYAARDLAIGE